MDPRAKPRILVVDDEPRVLDALARQLRGKFEVKTAVTPMEGLAAIEAETFAVVMSDMQMPVMNGATFLSRVRERAPDTVRLLLTGFADVDGAIAAVNEGSIFRFLRKPCPTADLIAVLEAAAQQHRLLTAEKELLERTLRGSIEALTETLALLNPEAFGSALRVRRLIHAVAEAIAAPDLWEIDVAVMMAKLGAATLPEAVVTKLSLGAELTADERAMVFASVETTDKLLAKIPRLEGVRAILRQQNAPFDDPKHDKVPIGSRLLRLGYDYDAQRSAGLSRSEAILAIEARAGAYDPRHVRALAEVEKNLASEPLQVTLEDLRPGMFFAADVKLKNGVLLVSRGHEVTSSLLARLKNFRERLPSNAVLVCPEP